MRPRHLLVGDKVACGRVGVRRTTANPTEATCAECTGRVPRGVKMTLPKWDDKPDPTPQDREIARLTRSLTESREQTAELRRELVRERARTLDLATKDRFHHLIHSLIEAGIFADVGAVYRWVSRYLDRPVDLIHARQISPAEVDALSETARTMLRVPQKNTNKGEV